MKYKYLKTLLVAYMHIPSQLPRQPQERLLEVVVRFGRDLQILEIFLPVESDVGRLDFSLLHHRSDMYHDGFSILIIP